MREEEIKPGTPIWVTFGKQKEAGRLLNPVYDGLGHTHYAVELLKENALSPGQLMRQAYPKPVLAHRLSVRQEKLPGEA